MSDQRIDHIFKQRLGDGAMPVPGGLWESIEPHLPTAQRRNRWGLIWIIGAGALILAGTLLWMNLFSEKAESITSTVATPQSNSFTSTAAVPEHAPAIKHEGELLSEQKAASKQTTDIASSLSRTSSSTARRSNAQGTFPVLTKTSVHPPLRSSDEAFPVQSAIAKNEAETGITLRTNSPRLALPFIMLATDANRKLPDPAKDCYSFGRKGSGGKQGVLFAEAYAGPTFASRKLTSRAEDVSSYITQRDTTESSRLSWHAGLRLGYLHRTGLTLRIGGHYTLVNELFDYVDGSFTGTITRIDTTYDGGGNIIDIDTVMVPVSGKRIKTTHNRYHTIDIPVLIGYQFMQNNWSYGIQAGPVFNAAFIKKGDILDPAGDPVSISDNNAAEYPAYKDKLGLSIYVAAHIDKRIGYRTIVYAEPYFQRRLSSLTLDSYPIDQRQTNVGLSLGLRVILQ